MRLLHARHPMRNVAVPITRLMAHVRAASKLQQQWPLTLHIDVTQLAATMRRVFDDPVEAQQRARAGRELLRDRYSSAALADTYRRRLEELGILRAR